MWGGTATCPGCYAFASEVPAVMAARVEAHRDLEQEKTGMDSIGFYLFCLSIGYVIVWFLVNERTGNEDGEWGLLAMRRTIEPARPEDGSKGTSNREPQNRRF